MSSRGRPANAVDAVTTTGPKPFDKFKDLAGGLFTVSKSELDARLAEEKATRQAERERRRREKVEKQK